MANEPSALMLFRTRGAGREHVVVNPHNGQEEYDPFTVRVRELAEKTRQTRFKWKETYTNLVPIVNATYRSKSEVLSCTRIQDKKSVVLKVKKVNPKDEYGRDKTAAQKQMEMRFNLFEVHFMERLAVYSHPHIIKLNAVWVVEKFFEVFIETDRYDGNLATLMLETNHLLPVPRAKKLLRQCLLALQYCHSNGILHCDVKGENVLMRGDAAVLADFDVSREIPLSTTPPVIPTERDVNDARYQPIELLLHTPFMGFAVDMYAIGCVFVKMFTGKVGLFETFDRQEQLCAIHEYAGPIDDWYFANGSNINSLTNPIHYLEKYARPVVGFSAYFDFLPRCPALRDLARRFLEVDAMRRISASAALQHQFFFISHD
jgi:serine/threonine protein kinase